MNARTTRGRPLGRSVVVGPEHLVHQRLAGIQAGPARSRFLPFSRIKARYDNPARASQRIAAYKSTLDFGGAIAASSREARACSHRKPPGVARTQRHRPPAKPGVPRSE
jgi:hypothetical protein